jgi:transposase
MKLTPSETTNSVLNLLDQGYSTRQIASRLDISNATVSRIRSRQDLDSPLPSPGRPSRLTSRDIAHGVRLIESGQVDTAVQLTKVLGDITNSNIHPSTTRRALKSAGLKAITKPKKPRLLKRHIKARYEFAQRHQHWTVEDWKQVIWSDETKINRLGSDGRSWVWKQPSRPHDSRTIQGTVKFGGGSLMMWGCMCWEGPGYATKIDTTLDSDLYVEIMGDELVQTVEYYHKDLKKIIFQHDNDPKHTSKKAKEWLQNNDVTVLTWPAQSPDLNPIEHLWEHLKRQLARHENPPNKMEDLWPRVEEEWNKIDPSVCQNLIESMPRRVAAVLKAKGGYTKY